MAIFGILSWRRSAYVLYGKVPDIGPAKIVEIYIANYHKIRQFRYYFGLLTFITENNKALFLGLIIKFPSLIITNQSFDQIILNCQLIRWKNMI